MFKLILIIFVIGLIIKYKDFLLGLGLIIGAFWIHPLVGIGLIVICLITSLKDNKKKEEPKQSTNNNEQNYQKQQYQERPKQQTQYKQASYFSGCNTKEQLKKRHRELCKKYHPDKGGNPEIFKKMQAEYEMLKNNY